MPAELAPATPLTAVKVLTTIVLTEPGLPSPDFCMLVTFPLASTERPYVIDANEV